MFDRSRTLIDEPETLEERTHAPVVSEAEEAACNCPDLCIRDHDE